MQQHAAKRRRAGSPADGRATAAAPDDAAVPLLVRVLAGNSVTSITILACLNTADARHARRLHPAVAGVVAAIPWCDTDTPVVDTVLWRAGLPAAVGARLAGRAAESLLAYEPAVAALAGVTHLDLRGSEFVTDDVLLRLPTLLHTLNVHGCDKLTACASFAHLPALRKLDCSWTKVAREWADGLPPSLQELDVSDVFRVWCDVSLAHLRQLRVLHADGSCRLGTIMLASLPPSLEALHATGSRELTYAASFAHLTALRVLDVAHSAIGDASLVSMPSCLVSLNAHGCIFLTPAAVLPHLPALRLLDVSNTDIGDALVASLPASLVELRLAGCHDVTARASLDHVRALRLLHCIDTELAPAVLAGCRTRGCVVLAVGVLRGHESCVGSLVVLHDGQLASGDIDGEVRLWDVAAGGAATAVLSVGNEVHALAADGRRLAIGSASQDGDEGDIEVWGVEEAPPVHIATIDCGCGVESLAMLANGCLAAGCDDGMVWVVDVDAGAVATMLSGHTSCVTALAALPGGALASGSTDTSVRVWDVGARACVAILSGHANWVSRLAVLPDGRLVSLAIDDELRLWDVGARACVGVLTGGAGVVVALTALPDGRLATGSVDGIIKLWDTRPAAGASRAVGAAPVEIVGRFGSHLWALLSLPDGRLACGGGASFKGKLCLLELPPPATAK